MTLNATPDELSIYTEFGAPLGTLLTAMVRGGAYVSNGSNFPGTVGIPSAPPISLLDFANKSNFRITVAPNPMNASVPNGTQDQGLTITRTGGTGGFTFSTTILSGLVGGSILNGTTANPTLRMSGTNQIKSGFLRCTCTDAFNGLVSTVDVEVNTTFGTPP